MAMTGASSSQSMSARDIGDSDSPSQVSLNVRAATPSSINAILLADGWHNVQGCQLVQFALGEAHSPITPTKLFPYISYTEDGREVYTPIGQILGYDLTGAKQQK